MVNVTELVMRYRQALNYLWNIHFYGQPEFREYEDLAAEDFLKCHLTLFTSLVTNRVDGFESEDPTFVFGETFKVIPYPGGNFGSPLMLTRTPGGGVFESIKGHFKAEDLQLSIIDFYDFRVRGWRDFRYYRCKVEEFPSNDSLVGCEALIDVGVVDVVCTPTRTSSSQNLDHQ